MRPRLLAAATLAALTLPVASASAAGDPVMPLAEVRGGMQCTGYSVVRGTDVAAFDVEVIDVVDSEPGSDGARILVEASGPAVDATGIGPGFSGSPIYCPDAAGVARNIGAISESIGDYGGRVVLATPIEAILATSPDAPKPRRSLGNGPRSERAAAALRRIRTEGTRPLVGPLTIGGVSRPLGRALEAAGRKAGRPVVTVPAGPLGSYPPQQLRPGSAVSVGYSSGDVRIGGIGTVAYTDADRVWAFGHPFESAGARSLLLQDAYVFRVVNDPNASLTGGSYKLAVGGHDLGTLSNDGYSAVVGRIGGLPRTIPVRAVGIDADTGARRVVETTVADETDVDNPTGYSPLSTVAPVAVAQAGGSAMGASPGRSSGSMCLRMTFRERPNRPVRFCNRYVSSSAFDPYGGALGNPIALSAAYDVLDAISLIEVFEGPTPHVSSLKAEVKASRGEQLAILRDVKAPRRVRAGRTVRMKVVLQRIRGGQVVRTRTLRVPRRVRPGVRRLTLRGLQGGSPEEAFFEVLFGEEDLEEEPQTRGRARLGQLLKAIEGLERWDGVEQEIGGRRKRAFRDPELIVAGLVRTEIRVLRAQRRGQRDSKR